MVKPATYIRSWDKHNKFPFQLLAALRVYRSSVPAKIVERALVLAEGADARLADVEKIDDLLKRDALAALGAVSYTHLDVYKRQLL